MIWLVLAAALAEEPGWEPVLDESYRFCHTPGAQADEARQWCDLLDEIPEDRCPGLRETCAGAPPQTDMADFMEAIRGCGQGGGEGKGFAPPKEPEPSRPMSCDQQMNCSQPPEAGFLPAVFRWVVAILVAVAILVLLRLLVSWWSGRIERTVAAPPSEPIVTLSDDPNEVPELPSADLLAAARRALAEGRTGEAVLLARGAALRRLGELGRLSLHRARTDREYVRAVRKDAAVYEPLREVVRAVEAHRWGGRAVSIDVAKAALSAAERLVGVAVLLLALLVGADARAQSRYGPWGDAALRELYARGGYDASWRLRGLESLDDTTDVLVIDLVSVGLEDADEQALRAWVDAGGVLIAAGEVTAVFPEVGSYRDDSAWWADDEDTDADVLPAAPPTDLLVAEGRRRARTGRDAPPMLSVPRFADGAWACFQLDPTADSWIEADVDGGPCTVVAAIAYGNGGVIAIADVRLLRNASLAVPRNEAFLLEAPYAGYDAGMWDLPLPAKLELATRAGKDSQNPFTALANAKMLPVVLQLLGLGVLVAMWRGWPFGPLRDPPEEGRLAFAEHVRALGTRYARAGASRHALSSYSRLWLARLGPAGIEQAARRAGMDAERARRLVERVEEAAENPEGPNRPEDLEIVEELWRVTQR